MATTSRKQKKSDHSVEHTPLYKLPFNRLIWNMTKICPWDCQFCCVDAYHISQKNNKLIIKKNGLKDTSVYTRNFTKNRYEEANQHLKKENLELSFFEKMVILKNIDVPISIDFSGGDPLVLGENLEIIKKASHKFGRSNISVTTTGVGLSLVRLNELAKYTGDVDFTYDYSGDKNVPFRMDTYNHSNLNKIKNIKKYNVAVTAQIPITIANSSYEMVKKIYMDLKGANVDNILLMKLLPVGRGENLKPSEMPSLEDEKYVFNLYKYFESKYCGPKVNGQSVLKNNLKNIKSIYSSSLNISSQGLLLSSPWAYDGVGNPKDDYVIGDIKFNRLSVLASTLKEHAK